MFINKNIIKTNTKTTNTKTTNTKTTNTKTTNTKTTNTKTTNTKTTNTKTKYTPFQLFKSKLKSKKSQKGGEVVLGSMILLLLTTISVIYMHFSYVIKLFTSFILLKCDPSLEGQNLLTLINVFIKNNFRDLFIQYLVIVMFTFIGPFSLILNNFIVHMFVKYLLAKAINKVFKKTTEPEFYKFNKRLQYLSEKPDYSISNMISKTIQNTTNSLKYKLSCISQQIIPKLTSNKNLNKNNTSKNTLNENLYSLIFLEKTNTSYKFEILNLKNNTIDGNIDIDISNADKLYLNNKTHSFTSMFITTNNNFVANSENSISSIVLDKISLYVEILTNKKSIYFVEFMNFIFSYYSK